MERKKLQLFRSTTLQFYLDNIKIVFEKKINSMSLEYLRGDKKEIFNSLFETYELDVPIVDKESIEQKRSDIYIDIYIPFSGNQDLFFMSVKRYSFNICFLKIENSFTKLYLVDRYCYNGSNKAKDIKDSFDKNMEDLITNLGAVSKGIKEFKKTVEKSLICMIENREKLLTNAKKEFDGAFKDLKTLDR